MPKKINAPEFLKGRATMGLKREFENAVTRSFMERRIKPSPSHQAISKLEAEGACQAAKI